ncbi:MAG TPA: Ldh family oxidoreductase [Vicinamibacteria bacterium]|jgi:L-2-hydroxycarboxylate dehydrogenase (NAD+)|nr:Ldh family oxidoreductase [Vicinamibacteria bacterium]
MSGSRRARPAPSSHPQRRKAGREVEVRFFPAPRLREFSIRVFSRLGVPEAEARIAADVLACADSRGVDSHGVARLRSYAELLAAGKINPRPVLRLVRETASTATVDGDNGLGLVVGPKVNEIAMEKAERAGTGWAVVRNSNHFGIAGYYPLRALERGMIGWAMTNSSRGVAPLWGAERMLGTNPIAIAFPAEKEPPIVIDMATSAVAYGKIEMAQREGAPIPEGWAVDRNGQATTDPGAILAGGSLLPLGSDRERGGHKGYCLALMVDVLSAVLSGANWGPFTPSFTLRGDPPLRSVGQGLGHFFGAMRVDAFRDGSEFRAQIDDFVRTLRNTRPAPGTKGPLIPGDPEREAEEERARGGIPLLPAVVKDLCEVSRQTGVPFE